MSRIYKRTGSPYWWYTAGDYPNRIRKSTGTKDKKVAIRIQAKWDQEIALRNSGVEVQTVDLQIAYRHYIDIITQTKSKSRSRDIKSKLNIFMKLNPGITNKHLTSLFLQEYYTDRRDMGRSPKTISEDHKVIDNWCDWMVLMGYLTKNPEKGLIRPKLIKVKPRQSFTRDEVYTALENARKDKDRLFWSILYKTGLRSTDACNLSIDNINGRFIELNQEKTEEYFEPRKVVIPIHKELQEQNIFNVMTPGATGRSRERLKEILPHGDLHSFRHSFASHLEEFGATRWDTKCLMGHKANDVTAQYVKVNVERLSPLINML